MSQKLKMAFHNEANGREVRIYYSYRLEEYRCRLIENGKANPEADYFTDDEDDAYNTAKKMAGLK